MGDGTGLRYLLLVIWLVVLASAPMLVVVAAGLALLHGTAGGPAVLPWEGYEKPAPP